MYLKPKKFIWSKSHKGRTSHLPKIISSQSLLSFGSFGLMALEPSRLKASHIYAIELSVKRLLKREGHIWFRVFPNIPVTKKPQQVRMGKGKGSVDYWMTRLQKGSLILELECQNPILAVKALKVASSKLPCKTKILSSSTLHLSAVS